MKIVFFFLLSLSLIATGCKKESANEVIPGGKVASQAVGKWMYGSFSMSDFWTYDGRNVGKPFELAVVFDFKSNGTYEQYFIAASQDYIGCRIEAFTYEKGAVNFNEADGSFTTTPVEGKYRSFYSCTPNKNSNRPMDRSELTSKTYYYELKKGSNGNANLVVRFNKTDSNVSTFLPTSW